MERLDLTDYKTIIDAASGFASTDIYFTLDNVGTAAARLDLLHRGAKQHYDYLMFTDDDITFPNGGIEEEVRVLDTYPEVGAVSLRPYGINKVRTVVEKGRPVTNFNENEKSLCEVYVVGSASIMFRSELYTTHLIAPDPSYYIGTWDFDFAMQIREAGYKLCMVTNKEIVNGRTGSREYRRKRKDRRYIRVNNKLFTERWGFDPRLFYTNVKIGAIKPVDKSNPLVPRQHSAEALQKLNEELFSRPVLVPIPFQPRQGGLKLVEGTGWRSRIRAAEGKK
jgi:GT2 family glycosyltransferase